MAGNNEKQLKVILPEFGMSPELRDRIANAIGQSLGNMGNRRIKRIEDLTVPASEAKRVRESVLRMLGDRGLGISINNETFQLFAEKEDPREAMGY